VKNCVHIYVNAKMIAVETVPGIWGLGIKRAKKGMNSSVIYLMYSKNLCKCHSAPPSSTIKEKKKKEKEICSHNLVPFKGSIKPLHKDE
jgi:hypothetical protein